MDYENLTTEILDKLGIFWDDLAYNKKTKVSYGDLIYNLLKHRSMKESSDNLGISNRTLERIMPIAFSSFVKSDSGHSDPWQLTLLKIVDKRICPRCMKLRSISKDYYKGQYKLCKFCYREKANSVPKEITRQRSRKYYRLHIGQERARLSLNTFRRKQRKPSWFSTEKVEIERFYKNCPEGYHVDHIIPLLGKEVSGLHTLRNLQYLTVEENLKKGNNYIEGY